MTKRMLIDATHEEETRVAIVDGKRLLEFDYESKYRKPLKGSIFLAKVTRVEPSLQAAFVNFGGNRHGFLPFSEIHPDYFRIPIADREALLAEQAAALEADHDDEGDEDNAPGAHDQSTMMDAGQDFGSEGAQQTAGDEETDSFDQERYTVEEVGGAAPDIEGEDTTFESPLSAEPKATGDFGQGYAGTDEFAAEVAEGDDQRGEEFSASDQSFQGEDAQGGEGEEGGRHQGRRDRFRRGGRGQHRRRGNKPFRSRQVESFGGEEYEDDGRFRFNLRRKYKIQEVIKRGQIMLVQVSKEERGNKGAAVTSYLSLPGRYCVLMPNSPRGGGVSRKIASFADRARMREMLKDMEVPQGMSVIVRTAGVSRTKPEIKRDLDYLMRLWDNIRELTLQSTAPAMVYEEADLIKRAVRDLYARDMDEIIVAGEEGFKNARNFMKLMMPSHLKRVLHYEEQDMPLFNKYHAESQIAEIGESQFTLPSGGYLVINQTEALVAIDVNSGKATKERHIEETALKTNLEAAEEVARQLRLRDLGGLVVVDFIDMEDRRNNAKVERRMRDALSSDRARIQMGRISSFGLMELSRQRLNPSLTESQFEVCSHCKGMGRTRTADASSLMILRAIEDEGIKRRGSQLIVHVSSDVAVYILNHKRQNLSAIEARHDLNVSLRVDGDIGAGFRIEAVRANREQEGRGETPRRDARHDANRQTGGVDMANFDAVEDLPDDMDSEDIDASPSDEVREVSGSEGAGFRSDRGDRGDRNGRRRGRRGGRGRNRGERGDGAGRPYQDRASGAQPEGQPFDQEQPKEAPSFDSYSDDAYTGFEGEDPDDHKFNREGAAEGLHAGSSLREYGQPGGRGRRGGKGRGGEPKGGRRGGHQGGGQSGGRPRRHEHSRGKDTQGGSGSDNSEGGGAPERVMVKSSAAPSFTSAPSSGSSFEIPAPRPRRTVEPQQSQDPKPYEKVNEAPSEKKRGWWNRFME